MFLILGTELMGTHIKLDSSREDSSILSSSSLRRESDTRDSEDNTSVQPLKLGKYLSNQCRHVAVDYPLCVF